MAVSPHRRTLAILLEDDAKVSRCAFQVAIVTSSLKTIKQCGERENVRARDDYFRVSIFNEKKL
jgi:hypothetical protein